VEIGTPVARYLGEDDRDALASFRCSTGAWFEDEVESFVATQLLRRHAARRLHTRHTVIGLEAESGELVAVGAHEEDLLHDGDSPFTSTFLVVAAVAVEAQGGTLPDVEPLDEGRLVSVGRYLLEVLMSDADAAAREPVFRAVVAKDNVRSLALCTRVGLTRVLADRDPRFEQRLGVVRQG